MRRRRVSLSCAYLPIFFSLSLCFIIHGSLSLFILSRTSYSVSSVVSLFPRFCCLLFCRRRLCSYRYGALLGAFLSQLADRSSLEMQGDWEDLDLERREKRIVVTSCKGKERALQSQTSAHESISS